MRKHTHQSIHRVTSSQREREWLGLVIVGTVAVLGAGLCWRFGKMDLLTEGSAPLSIAVCTVVVLGRAVWIFGQRSSIALDLARGVLRDNFSFLGFRRSRTIPIEGGSIRYEWRVRGSGDSRERLSAVVFENAGEELEIMDFYEESEARDAALALADHLDVFLDSDEEKVFGGEAHQRRENRRVRLALRQLGVSPHPNPSSTPSVSGAQRSLREQRA